MISEETIREAIKRLVKAAKPQRIYLFGSYARGDARKQSDLDFLVVEQMLKSRRKEMVRLHDAVRSMRIPVDILVTSESTFNEWSDVPGTVMYRVKSEGQLRYEES